jgi:hypothetical protein
MKAKPSVTLAEVIRLDARLATWCPRCQRSGRYLDPKELVKQYGPAIHLSAIGRHMVCEKCVPNSGLRRETTRFRRSERPDCHNRRRLSVDAC